MTPALYRKWIRKVIKKGLPFGVPEFALQESVGELAGGRFDLSAFRDAMEWNLAEDYIRASENKDTDQKEWKLTPRGEAKES